MDSMDKGLKIKLREEFIPLYIQLNGLRIPFKLFEACQSYKNGYSPRTFIESPYPSVLNLSLTSEAMFRF